MFMVGDIVAFKFHDAREKKLHQYKVLAVHSDGKIDVVHLPDGAIGWSRKNAMDRSCWILVKPRCGDCVGALIAGEISIREFSDYLIALEV